jgi:hypothetical protein
MELPYFHANFLFEDLQWHAGELRYPAAGDGALWNAIAEGCYIHCIALLAYHLCHSWTEIYKC